MRRFLHWVHYGKPKPRPFDLYQFGGGHVRPVPTPPYNWADDPRLTR